MISNATNMPAGLAIAFALFASSAAPVCGQEAPERAAEADVDALARPFEALWQFDTGG